MTDQTLFLQFLHIVPQTVLVIELPVLGAQGMQQAEIKVARPGALETGVDLLLGISFVLCHPGVDLRGQGVAVPRVTGTQRLAGRRFGALIDICGVKVGQTGFQELVRHHGNLFHVNGSVRQPRQTHQAEAQFSLSKRQCFCHFCCPPIIFQSGSGSISGFSRSGNP